MNYVRKGRLPRKLKKCFQKAMQGIAVRGPREWPRFRKALVRASRQMDEHWKHSQSDKTRFP